MSIRNLLYIVVIVSTSYIICQTLPPGQDAWGTWGLDLHLHLTG
jgi:hypothetical protein